MDDLYHNKTNYENQIFKNDVIHSCKIISKNVRKEDLDIYKLWRDNDILLDNEYKKLDIIHYYINKYYYLNGNLIKKNQLIFYLLFQIGVFIYFMNKN